MAEITRAMRKAVKFILASGERGIEFHDAAMMSGAAAALLRGNPESGEIRNIVAAVCARNCAFHGSGQSCRHGWCRKRQRYLLRLMMSSHPAAKNRLRTFRRVNNAVYITRRLLEQKAQLQKSGADAN